MSKHNDGISATAFSWSFRNFSINEDSIKDRKQEELMEDAEERLNKDEELAKQIEKEGIEAIYAGQEEEYLVEGALLTCSLATRKTLNIQGNDYESGMNVTETIVGMTDAFSRLKVKPKMEGINGCEPANIYDSKKFVNICPFGNCISVLTPEDIVNIEKNIETAKLTGICQCLMDLNNE